MDLFLTFGHLIFEFVSYFEIRISNLIHFTCRKSCPLGLTQSRALWTRFLLQVGRVEIQLELFFTSDRDNVNTLAQVF
jgi:hypothetical protein